MLDEPRKFPQTLSLKSRGDYLEICPITGWVCCVRHDLPFDEIADAAELSAPAFAEKDYYVVQALSAANKLISDTFEIAFAGGTCLTKAHGLTKRMSEDIDFKIIQIDSSLKGNPLKTALKGFRSSLCDALQEIGFEFDPSDRNQVEVSNQGKFTRINIDYTPSYEGEGQLRPHIQIEAALRVPRVKPVYRQVSSFAATVLGESPEIDQMLTE